MKIKNYAKWMISVLALMLIIPSALLLYKFLGSKYSDNHLVTDNSSQNQTASSELQNGNGSKDESEHESGRLKAPDFTVIDNEGKEVNLSDFKGKPIVINFWTSWCPMCKLEMSDFNESYIKNKNVQFLMVNITDGKRETLKKAKDFLKDKDYDFPVFFDTLHQADIKYKITSLPTSYFIDKDGYIIAHAFGRLDAETLQKGINMIV